MLVGKLVVSALNTKMLLISQDCKPIIAAQSIKMNITFKLNAAPDENLQGGF